MKGDVIVSEEHHKRAVKLIVPHILNCIAQKASRYIISVAGESGSGKSETGQALADELGLHGIQVLVLGQDDYFVLPPRLNAAKRRENSEWLGAAEGTYYTSLLKNVDTRVFIARDRLDTQKHRKKRKQAGEAGDPFVEQVLVTEHKIIAAHKQLADFVVTKDYDVIVVVEGE